jgi:YD repeat-containing protein
MTFLTAASMHSDARNFISFIHSGVDPRTGTYSCSIPLPDVFAGTKNGPSIPLALAFDALKMEDIGLGLNWHIPLSRFDSRAGMLHLFDGTSYPAKLEGDTFSFPDKKVRSVSVSKPAHLGNWFIRHKSGLVEVLTNTRARPHEWLTTVIRSPEGHAFELRYKPDGRCLHDIRDENKQRLLAVDIENVRNPSITFWPDYPEKTLTLSVGITQSLGVRDGRLHSMTLLGSPGDSSTQLAHWSFKYQNIGLLGAESRPADHLTVLSELNLPNGAIEKLEYQPSAFRLYKNRRDNGLPAVSKHEVIPGGNQPSIKRAFSYSSNNYLQQDPGPLVRTPSGVHVWGHDYEYDSTEILDLGNNRKRTTKRIYNRYHLLARELTTQGNKIVMALTEYGAKNRVSFKDQPPNFQLPRIAKTVYKDEETGQVREEVIVTEYDDYGNLLKQVLPSGITELFEYYPTTASEGCPADELPIVRWLKQKTVVPAPGHASAPSTITRYRYIKLKDKLGWENLHLVESESTFEAPDGKESDTPVKVVKWHYDTQARSPFFGRVTRKIEAVNGVDSIIDYRYERVADEVKTRMTVSCMGVSSTRSTWHHALTGEETRTEDACGVVIETRRDLLGRTIQETVAAGTPNQAQRNYAYQPAFANQMAQVTDTDAAGVESRTRFDGLDRKRSVELQDVGHNDKPLRATYNATYDAMGQLVEETHTDWLDNQPYPLKTKYLYDDWGNRTATIGPDGTTFHDQQDPIALTRSQWQTGTGKAVSKQNMFGKYDWVERFDRANRSCGVTRYAYDGLGRCVQKTSAEGLVTQFTYDFADRVLVTRLPDGTSIKKEYVQHSIDDLPTRVWVNNYLAGERVYDGLARITRVTVGGRIETFAYEGAQPNPVSHTSASGKVSSYQYEPALNNQITERRVEANVQLSASFRYDNTHAQLIQASSSANQQQRSYSPSGMLKLEQFTENGVNVQSNHRTSLNGLALQYTDVDGVSCVNRYDAMCRISQVVRGSIRAFYTYGAVGRVISVTTQDTQSQTRFDTQLTYDDFGREFRRMLTVDRNEAEEITQRFNLDDKLIERTHSRGSVELRKELFQYDRRGRLAIYRCSGTNPPLDSHGKAIVRQNYQYDELDNIRRLFTISEGGQNTANYFFQNPDRTQLTSVTNSHADYADHNATFTYDLDGNQLNDERGRQLVYDELGRLASVKEVQP